MGIVELLVEKDQGGQQGKKVTGAMKLGGGILLLLNATTFISWLVEIQTLLVQMILLEVINLSNFSKKISKERLIKKL